MTYYILRGGSLFGFPSVCRAAFQMLDSPDDANFFVSLRLILPQ